MPLAHTTPNDAAVGRAEPPIAAEAAGDAPLRRWLFRVDPGHSPVQPPTAGISDGVAGPDQEPLPEPAADTPWLERIDAASELLRRTMRDVDGGSVESGEAEASAAREERWLRLHASDLIGELQRWSDDLDAREAQLNSRAALLDHRERQLRLQRQNAESDLAALRQSIDNEYEQLRAQARRLAFE